MQLFPKSAVLPNKPGAKGFCSRKLGVLLLAVMVAALADFHTAVHAQYIGSISTVSANSSVQSAATEILGNGGGSGTFTYKGGGNAIDAAVAAALAACVVNPGNCSLGGYGGHMMIYKSGWDGEPQLVTCIDFNSAAGSLATSNMFEGSVNLVNGRWTGPTPAANQYGWKAAGVPGTFGGLFMAQTNYGRKMDGTNYFPFSEIMKPALARVANGQVAGTAYYTLTSVSNLLMDLYTNSVGYTNISGQPNPNSSHDPYAVFYSGGIALDIAATMQANGGLVTYADMTNYRPREVVPYMRHFNPPNGTPATVCVAPPGSAGLSVLQEIAMIDALGWTNGTWDSLRYWHSRAEVARLMWKDHYQWIGDPWSGAVPPDFLGNGSMDFCEQLLAHATSGSPNICPWDPAEILLTNSLAGTITQSVNNQTNAPILVHWDDIRYGTRNITASDKWGNCVALTLSMGGGFGAQVAVTNRALVMGQGMALFDARPGWPDSIAPGKRPVNNMCPAIVIPDYPFSPTNGFIGGRPPFAIGGVGGSTIENNMAMQLIKYLMDPPSSGVTAPAVSLYNFEGNNIVYMRPSYPAGVQSYLGAVGYTAPGGPPSVGEVSSVQAWIPPMIMTQPSGTNVSTGATVTFEVTAIGLPLFYQWLRNGVPLTDGATISGAQTPRLTVSSITTGGGYSVIVANGAASITSAPAGLTIDGAPAIVSPPASRTTTIGTLATFSVTAIGDAPLVYKWLKNGAPLADGGNVSGANGTSLDIANVSAADVATYSVVVTNFAGAVTSDGATLTMTQTNSPALFLYEPFAYSNIGGPVGDNTPENWTYGGSGANDLSVVNGNLSYSGLSASIGNSVTNGGTGLGVRRLFGTNFTSGKIYFSALFRINDLGFGAWSGVSSTVGALCATNNTSFQLQVVVRSNSPSGYIIGTQKSGTDALPTYDTSIERRAGDTVFLVGKYDFTVVPNVVRLWINPDSTSLGAESEPISFLSATSGTDGLTIDRFNMRQNAASGSFSVPAAMQWDELRFGLSWEAVTPAAPPSVIRLTDIMIASDGTFQFTYANNDGRAYSVFASTNLIDWNSIGTATEISPGSFQFIDLDAANNLQRFYQVRRP